MEETQTSTSLAELQEQLAIISDKDVPLSERCSKLHEHLDSENTKLSATLVIDYDRMECLNYVTGRTEIVFGEIEAYMLAWSSEVARLRAELSSLSKTVDGKLMNEDLPPWDGR